jgi:hypothetical protein
MSKPKKKLRLPKTYKQNVVIEAVEIDVPDPMGKVAVCAWVLREHPTTHKLEADPDFEPGSTPAGYFVGLLKDLPTHTQTYKPKALGDHALVVMTWDKQQHHKRKSVKELVHFRMPFKVVP